MHLSFDSEVAAQHGLNEAILIHCVQFWIRKNRADGRHQHEGRTWTYQSAKSFTKLFEFWSRQKAQRTVQSLLDQGILIKGNYSTSWSDRTNWYAFADECKWLQIPIAQNCAMQSPNVGSDIAQNRAVTLPRSGQCTDQLGTSCIPDRGGVSANVKNPLPPEVWEWNLHSELRKVVAVGKTRMAKLEARRKDPFFQQNFSAAVDRVAQSSFCTGKNDRGWTADFDWMLQPDVCLKVMEGKYDDRPAQANGHQTRMAYSPNI
jgi:hypothetical protein